MTAHDAARRTNRIVLGGSAWILVGVALQSALGLAFWMLGARVGTRAQLGRASQLYTDLQFVNFVSGLGLTVALARDAVGGDPDADRLLGWAVVATVVSSVVAGLGFLFVVRTPATLVLASGPAGRMVFCLYTAGMSVALLADVRLMAARAWPWIVGRIVVVGLVRLPLVFVSTTSADAWLYHLMLAPLALGGVVALVLLPRCGAGSVRLGWSPRLGAVSRFAAVSWAATLASQAPQFVLPVLVARYVAPSVFAGFFLAWTITGLVLLAPAAIAQILLIEGAKGRTDTDAAHPADPAVPGRASLVLAVAAVLGALVVRQLVLTLGLVGLAPSVADALPGLLLGGVPWAVTALWLTEARLRSDHVTTVAATATLGIVSIGLAWRWVPNSGVSGAIHAWWWGQSLALAVTAAGRRRPHRAGRCSVVADPPTLTTLEVSDVDR